MPIQTDFFDRCIQTLEVAYSGLLTVEPDSIEYEMSRSASVKEFEIILEQAGKLLKKCLKDFSHSPKAVDRLVFKEIFRQAAQYDLITLDAAQRWLTYRDNRNNTAHDYGKQFAEETLTLLPDFIADASQLAQAITAHNTRVQND